MTVSRRSVVPLSLLLLLGLAGCPPPSAIPPDRGPTTPPTGSPAGPEVLSEGPLNPEAERSLLDEKGPPSSFPLQTPDGKRLVFVVDRSEPAGRGVSLIGHVDGIEMSSGVITILGKAISGSIRLPGSRAYVFVTVNGKRVLRLVDTSKLPPDHPEGYFSRPRPGGPEKPPKPLGTAGDTCSTDDPRHITVLMLYTADARTAAGGKDEVEAAIYAAIAEANQAFINSAVDTQFDLVHLEEVAYTASGTSTASGFVTDVCRLHDPGDGFLDNAPTLRDTYQADLVALVITSTASCGTTYGQLLDSTKPCTDGTNHDVVRVPGNVHEEGAYHVLALSCIQTNFTLPHEFAHSGSARHNWECDGSDNLPTHSNHGFFFDDGTAASWRTIMTYPISLSCGHNGGRVPFFSNPAVSNSGHPTGTSTEPNPADNHDVLGTTRAVLANYRCSTPPPSNVWMKDTWGDTGVEPDPDPDIMYASPYVWTRRSQDATTSGFTDRYQHEHQHQNPVIHQQTWAYVKLHNDGTTTASGHVKLYYANASVSLSWPAGFTLVGDVSVSGFAAGSTKVVEVPWADPPGTGHYCLTARWESPSDPIPPESSDINANTRNSNNVIWRNLEILAMPPPGGDVATSFIARPVRGRVFTLQFITPGPRPFLPLGGLSFTLRPSGAKPVIKLGSGIVEEGGRYHVKASNAQVTLTLPHTPKDFLTVELRVHRTPGIESRPYRLQINQLEETEGVAARVIGGMAYDLQPGASP